MEQVLTAQQSFAASEEMTAASQNDSSLDVGVRWQLAEPSIMRFDRSKTAPARGPGGVY